MKLLGAGRFFLPQSGFIRRGAGFGAEKNEDGAAQCRQLLPGGPVTAKKSERAPYSHSFGAACYTAPVIKDLFSSEGTRTLSWATY